MNRSRLASGTAALLALAVAGVFAASRFQSGPAEPESAESQEPTVVVPSEPPPGRATEPVGPSETLVPSEPAAPPAPAPPSPEARSDPPLERLLAVPAGSKTNQAAPPGSLSNPTSSPAQPGAGSTSGPKPDWLDLSVGGKTEQTKGTREESREVKAGVTVSPGKEGATPGDVSLTVEGGVREDTSGRATKPAERSNSVGVRVEVPLPGQKLPKPKAKPDAE